MNYETREIARKLHFTARGEFRRVLIRTSFACFATFVVEENGLKGRKTTKCA